MQIDTMNKINAKLMKIQHAAFEMVKLNVWITDKHQSTQQRSLANSDLGRFIRTVKPSKLQRVVSIFNFCGPLLQFK